MRIQFALLSVLSLQACFSVVEPEEAPAETSAVEVSELRRVALSSFDVPDENAIRCNDLPARTALLGYLQMTGEEPCDCHATERGNYECNGIQVQLWYERDGFQHAITVDLASNRTLAYVSWETAPKLRSLRTWSYSRDSVTSYASVGCGRW